MPWFPLLKSILISNWLALSLFVVLSVAVYYAKRHHLQQRVLRLALSQPSLPGNVHWRKNEDLRQIGTSSDKIRPAGIAAPFEIRPSARVEAKGGLAESRKAGANVEDPSCGGIAIAVPRIGVDGSLVVGNSPLGTSKLLSLCKPRVASGVCCTNAVLLRAMC